VFLKRISVFYLPDNHQGGFVDKKQKVVVEDFKDRIDQIFENLERVVNSVGKHATEGQEGKKKLMKLANGETIKSLGTLFIALLDLVNIYLEKYNSPENLSVSILGLSEVHFDLFSSSTLPTLGTVFCTSS
jgi:hypothetical protein